MRVQKKGSLTIVLALTMMFFLTLCLVLIEGTRIYFLRMQALQAMELAEFSVLSEYQQELFSQYGLFYLDLDYEQGDEHTGILKERMKTYLSKNTEETITEEIEVKDFTRATDAGGYPFFLQAVKQQKFSDGWIVLEGIFERMSSKAAEDVDLGGALEECRSSAERILGGYQDDGGMPLFDISLPGISFPSIDALTEAVFGDSKELSSAKINSEERLMNRTRKTGICAEKTITFTQMQLFYGYMFDHLAWYGSEDANVWKECLKYQVEYVVSGEDNDKKNLENIMWRIFLLRAGGNYLFYHQDSGKMAEAETEATALAGITGNPVLIEIVREILLISKAIESGIAETRRVFSGEKVPFYENGFFSGIEIGYQEYLLLFLMTTERTETIYRCMDVVELEVRKHSDYEEFRMDHCTERFDVVWNYRFDSLFAEIPLLEINSYKFIMEREVFYDR